MMQIDLETLTRRVDAEYDKWGGHDGVTVAIPCSDMRALIAEVIALRARLSVYENPETIGVNN